MAVYILRKPKPASGLREAHIFAANPGAGRGCICLPKALCQAATTAATTGLEGFMCLTGARMLARAGEHGGGVCAECLLLLHEAERP